MSKVPDSAIELQQFVIQKIRHDYEKQPDHFDPERLLQEGYGRCGHRAVVFQYLATREGLTSRIAFYRGHVINQVLVNGEWVNVDCTRPDGQFHAELIKHILSGPSVGVSTRIDVLEKPAPRFQYGEYSQWLLALQHRHVRFLLPRDLLHGIGLSNDVPNVILRHDICGSLGSWMAMVHEENQLGIRSVTYVRCGEIHNAQLYKMFEHEGFEIGLHITAIHQHGLTLQEAMDDFWGEYAMAKTAFNIETVQAHGYDDAKGVPAVTNYDVERQVPFGFANLVEGTGKYAWRIADSLGVMYPSNPLQVIGKLKKGKLYYCLWHPEYYSVRNGWAKYDGLDAEPFTDERLERHLKAINRRYVDTPYFDTAKHPHLNAVADYLKKHGRLDEQVVDLGAGWGLLGLLIRDKHMRYVPIDLEYKRMKAGQTLYQSLKINAPPFQCHDLLDEAPVVSADWVVLVGWEGDMKKPEPIFKWLGHAGRRLILSYINQEKYEANWSSKFPTNHYRLTSESELHSFISDNELIEEKRLTKVYRDGFPREIAVLRRNN